jgi:ribonuclease VapC
MIAVDTSALMAMLLQEPSMAACKNAIDVADRLVISAATLAEALIVADRRSLGTAMRALLDAIEFEVMPVEEATTARIADVYSRWGKGVHPASLNIIDCFAYDVARQNSCPLLFVGNDFAKTDVKPAITPDS